MGEHKWSLVGKWGGLLGTQEVPGPGEVPTFSRSYPEFAPLPLRLLLGWSNDTAPFLLCPGCYLWGGDRQALRGWASPPLPSPPAIISCVQMVTGFLI